MDQKLKVAISIVVIVFLVSLTVLVNVLIANYTKKADYIGLDSLPTVQVRGSGEVSVVPDVVEMSFSVVTTDADSETAVSDNNEKMERVVDYLKGEGVEDIKTGRFDLRPLYEYLEDSRRRVVYNYEVTNTVEVKLRDIEKASSIIDGAVKAGANRVDRFNLLVEEEDQYKEEAREMAIKEARKKAEKISDSLGTSLGRVVGFSEDTDYRYPIMREDAAGGASGVPIEAGENDISVSVRIEYEIK